MKREKLLLAGACLLLCLSLGLSGTFAWLSKEQEANDAYTALSDFELEGKLTFSDKAPVYSGDSLLIPVSLVSGGTNDISTMKYVVRYSGVSPAYIRVRILEQWLDTSTNEIISSSFLKYAVPKDGAPAAIPSGQTGLTTIPAAGSGAGALAQEGEWVDNRATDYCYYYSVPVQPKQLTTPDDQNAPVDVGEGTVELTLFAQTPKNTADMLSGIDLDNTQLTLLIEVEAVQPNRYREFWHIDAIPAP